MTLIALEIQVPVLKGDHKFQVRLTQPYLVGKEPVVKSNQRWDLQFTISCLIAAKQWSLSRGICSKFSWTELINADGSGV